MQTIAKLIGMDATEKLISNWGGIMHLSIPTPENLKDDHILIQKLGKEAAIQLATRWGGDTISVSLCTAALRKQRNARIDAMYASGKTVVQITHATGLHERSVWRILADVNEQKKQLNLF